MTVVASLFSSVSIFTTISMLEVPTYITCPLRRTSRTGGYSGASMSSLPCAVSGRRKRLELVARTGRKTL
jgi:hypothetical protein